MSISKMDAPAITSARRSSSLYTLTAAGQPAGLNPALNGEVVQDGSAYGLYSSFPGSMPRTPSVSRSTPHLSRTDNSNTSTLGSANPRRSSSSNQWYTPTGAGQPASPNPAPGIQGGLAYEYTDFPWTAEPENISIPTQCTPESVPRLPKTKSTRVQETSKSTLTDASQPVAYPHPGFQGGSGHKNTGSSSATILQTTPTPAPFTQARSHPSRQQRNPQPTPPQFSKYTAMLLALDKIPIIQRVLIKFFVWILLAGFLVLPATFLNVQNKLTPGQNNSTESQAIRFFNHLPLFIIGCACGGIGILGMCLFWYRWHSNYVWLCHNIFGPGTLSALQGVIATLASNYGNNDKLVFVGSSKWTLIATSGVTVACGVLFLFYSLLIHDKKKQHDEEYGKRQTGKHGEGTGFGKTTW